MNLLIIRLNAWNRTGPGAHGCNPNSIQAVARPCMGSSRLCTPGTTTRGSKARGLAASRHTQPMRYRDVMQFTCSIVSFYRRSTLCPAGLLPIPTASLTMLHERDAIVVVVADERLSAAAPLNIRSQLPLRHLQTRALATRSLSI